ncbi:lipid-binding protein [Martiniozyma asiatica (nom. inval.)]|nr:lipid-binding protein [Martiniozyma asiatica]
MSDAGRKNFSTKVSETFTPNSEKNTYDKVKESVTDTADKVASNFTPDENKSFGQRVGDAVQRGHDDAKDGAEGAQKSWGESAHEYVEAGKHAVSDAAEYVSGIVTGAKEGASDYTKKN